MIAGAEIAVGAVKAKTNRFSQAALDLSALPAGPATMSFTPPSGMAGTAAAGPATLSGATTVPERLFRPLSLTVTLKGGRLDPGATPAFAAGVDDAQVIAATADKLDVDWKPDFVRCPHDRDRPLSNPADPTSARLTTKAIVVHRTGADTIGSSLTEFTGSAGTGIHYLVDVDGFVVKMVQDARVAPHAGDSFWHGDPNVSGVSVGIELVNASGPFPKAQTDALVALLRALQGALGLGRHTVVTHCDVAVQTSRVRSETGHKTIDLTMSDRRHEDPGPQFDHTMFKANNVGTGVIPVPPAPPGAPPPYGGLFAAVPGVALRRNDDDSTHTYGGKARAAITASVIQEIQSDLSTIGYSINAADGVTPTGTYDTPTIQAVNAFQRHFLNRGNAATGAVDAATATAIKGVLADLATP
jgi:N-acetyl-anhydromuramyl-L-alanine amidase AmpD